MKRSKFYSLAIQIVILVVANCYVMKFALMWLNKGGVFGDLAILGGVLLLITAIVVDAEFAIHHTLCLSKYIAEKEAAKAEAQIEPKEATVEKV
jgi:hypothetical protein